MPLTPVEQAAVDRMAATRPADFDSNGYETAFPNRLNDAAIGIGAAGREIATAAASAAAAKASQDAAKVSQDAAKASETASAGSATAAGTARTGAEGARDAAVTARQGAESARDTAQGHRTAAGNSATAAAGSATAAGDAKAASETARDASVAARAGSEAARDASVAARTGAETARDAAQTAASKSADNAAESEENAAISETCRLIAVKAAEDAATARTGAQTARNEAVAIVGGNGAVLNLDGFAQAGDLVIFDNATGTLVRTSGIQISDIITSNYVVTPRNLAPAAGATGLGQNGNPITLQATEFVQLAGVAFKSRQFRVSRNAAMTDLVIDSGALTSAGSAFTIADPLASGLQPSTTYHWQARYVDANDKASNWSNPTGFVTASKLALDFGDPYAGGFYGALVEYGGQRYRLVVSEKASGDVGRMWKTDTSLPSGSFSDFDGVSNMTLLPAAGLYPAADWCRDFRGGGFSDWYLGAFQEYAALFQRLKPGSGANDTSHGRNPYSVPPRNSNYTSGDPARTAVSLFADGGAQSFRTVGYFSSSTIGSSARTVFFSTGQAGGSTLNFERPVRPIRRVPVSA